MHVYTIVLPLQALGMLIIALFYPDPDNPTRPEWLLLVILAMMIGYVMRKLHFMDWRPCNAINRLPCTPPSCPRIAPQLQHRLQHRLQPATLLTSLRWQLCRLLG